MMCDVMIPLHQCRCPVRRAMLHLGLECDMGVQCDVCVFQRASAIWSGHWVVIAARHPVSARARRASPASRVTAAPSATSRAGRP